MEAVNEAAILRATMTDSGTFTRQVWNGREWKTEILYEGLACALSRQPQAAAPRTRGQWEDMGECEARLALFLPAGTVLRAGDRAEIRRAGQVLRGICGPCMPYLSHCFTTMLVQEVEAA
ncbi:MAG: hypothetical protein ACI3XU_08170 [Butyricicoccaceae bacterium]